MTDGAEDTAKEVRDLDRRMIKLETYFRVFIGLAGLLGISGAVLFAKVSDVNRRIKEVQETVREVSDKADSARALLQTEEARILANIRDKQSAAIADMQHQYQEYFSMFGKKEIDALHLALSSNSTRLASVETSLAEEQRLTERQEELRRRIPPSH